MRAKTLFITLFTLGMGVACMGAAPAKNLKGKEKMTVKAPYTKKYTNADFYTNGKFNQDVALKAYLDMFAYYGIEYTDFMKKNMWITDFSLGDFEHVGMAGIFWVNDEEHNYFGHEIYLLPNQMIVEHAHVATTHVAKYESWLVRNGSCYNYSIGEPTPNAPKLPASQKNFISVSHFQKMKVGDILSLAKVETKHFLLAGDNGVVVTEFANYHDGAGLRFTNPGVKF